MHGMDKWLHAYEERRTNPNSEVGKRLRSTRFDLENMSWDEIREIEIPELGCTFGGACSALRKSWYSYKRYKKDGMPAPDLALRINRIQSYLGFPKSEFPELEAYGGTGWVDEELTAEEKELRQEELDENEQNMDTGTSFEELLEDDW